MSTLSEEARAKAKEKAERLVRSDPHARVDASNYRPDGEMHADSQTGPRVLSRRQFRRGGKVAGEAAPPRADRKPRASGGRTLTADSLINRDFKEANQERDGTKHIGGMKKGGRIHKTMGGMALPAWADSVQRKDGGKVHADEAQDRELIHKMGCECGKCSGGRVGRREGGRTEYEANRALAQVTKPSGAATNAQDFAAMRAASRQGGDPYNTAKARLARKDGGRNWIAGAIKHPGSLHKSLHVAQDKKIPEKKLEKAEHSKNPSLARKAHLAETLKGLHKRDGGSTGGIPDGTRPVAGRLARKGGGRTKKGTNVNIIIAPQGGGQRPPMGAPMGMPPPGAGPVGLHQGAPPPAPVVAPPAATPGGAGAPLMRKSGGRTLEKDGGQLVKPGRYPIDAGAGGGLGRLEKAERAARG